MVRKTHLRDFRYWLGPRTFVVTALLVSRLLPPAQIVNASLYGSVTDQSGAATPGAAITATNVATGVGIKTTADETGNYLFPSLPPATYNIQRRKGGFQNHPDLRRYPFG
jgi:hypothetical protein